MTGTDLPLAGVRVVEMTHMCMGPTCGMILAQLGADVIKVEPPAGDKTRSLGGMGVAFFPLFNRGKRSVVLDFAKPEDRDTMHRLLATADVFVENFRDGQLEKQGLGPDELRKRYPQLIVCGHKGFLSGPYEHRPALDEVVQMLSGIATTTDRILARSRIIPRVAEEIKRWNMAELSERLDLLNICFSPINRPEDLLSDPHVLRPGGLVNNVNADGKPFRVPALPVEWNGGNIGEGLKVPVLGADTAAVRTELSQQKSTDNAA